MPKRTRDIRTIIDAAGGPKRIAEATEGTKRKIVPKSVYDWPRIGIPELHWPVLMKLVKHLTERELHRANEAARASPLSNAA